MTTGTVTLVGAGPGPADYLTLAALRAIEQSDTILFDALLAADVRALFPRTARAVYVGKRCGQHALTQEQINALLIAHAGAGERVVRLKGGDPFIFGRGGEEVAALRAAGISYQVVPGISALNGVAAQWALPLTDRSHSNEFRAIQGHTLVQDPAYWRDLAAYRGTVVIFMGTRNLQLIATRLLAHGAPAALPVAVIETATDGRPQLTKSDLVQAATHGFTSRTSGPGLIYIGSNVGLMDAAPHTPYAETSDAVAFANFS